MRGTCGDRRPERKQRKDPYFARHPAEFNNCSLIKVLAELV